MCVGGRCRGNLSGGEHAGDNRRDEYPLERHLAVVYSRTTVGRKAGSTSVSRRVVLQCGATLLGLRRPLSAAPAPAFTDLARPVTIALDDVAGLWQTVEFEAWAVDSSGRDLLLKGVLVRTNRTDEPADGLAAYCLACPHEFCYVGLADEPGAAELEVPPPAHPLFVCQCHFSAFDPTAGGARLAGPTRRGLYRFRVEVADSTARIAQVEAAVLEFLA